MLALIQAILPQLGYIFLFIGVPFNLPLFIMSFFNILLFIFFPIPVLVHFKQIKLFTRNMIWVSFITTVLLILSLVNCVYILVLLVFKVSNTTISLFFNSAGVLITYVYFVLAYLVVVVCLVVELVIYVRKYREVASDTEEMQPLLQSSKKNT